MLTISAVTKSFAGRVLFRDVSLQVNRGDRIGLVGANGAGKTTLFSLILGEESPDEGGLSMERGITFGFLPQESAAVGDETVLELATAVTPELAKASKTIREHEASGDTDAHEYHEALGEFADQDGQFEKPAKGLSGGWIMRAHLARLLTQQPDLLLLDEPTNHLDLESLVWFREHLRGYPGAILMISHDRDFLNQLVRDIVEISRAKLNRYKGNYDSYLTEKAAREVQHVAAYENQQREIDRLQDFVDLFRAKASKASQARSKLKQIERMDIIEAPEEAEARVKFRFPQPPRGGHRVITLKDVDFAYGELTVYRAINFEAERGQRIVLVGPNGAGKSTLLKLLAGVLTPQGGVRDIGHNINSGYFAQQRVEMLNSRHTVLEAAMDLPRTPGEQLARTILGSFLFRGDDVFKPVAVLSGGEKSRLALARLLLDPPNLLLMDEPTTHLDIPSIDALIGALDQFEGTLIFISHDVDFIRRLAQRTLHISAGQLTMYAGGYDYYLDKTKATSARDALVAGEQLSNFQPEEAKQTREKSGLGMKEMKQQRRAEAEVRKAAAKAKRDQEQKVATLEAKIQELEAKVKELTAALQDPEAHGGGQGAELSRTMTRTTAEIVTLSVQWERESEILMGMAPAAGG
jgi:ATP-binding cassette, subfamily F, member 3